jgi:pimeloyl-ACP methyl ester carboxylesterase
MRSMVGSPYVPRMSNEVRDLAAPVNVDDAAVERLRHRLRAGTAIRERRVEAAGIDTMVLECGEGPPLLLLHGPAEFAEAWIEVIPALATTHMVIAPDLPGHGASAGIAGLDTDRVLAWLGALIERTCSGPPVIVGRVLGGGIAARFAIEHRERIARLVLVDTLGLVPFDPAPAFGEAVDRYFAGPTEQTYDGLMQYCSFDFDALRHRLGDTWPHFAAYAVDRARTPGVLPATGALMSQFGVEIPETSLARISVPTTLIWGRHDLATPWRVAENASRTLGWPLCVIEDAADEPSLDQPAAFVDALRAAIEHEVTTR